MAYARDAATRGAAVILAGIEAGQEEISIPLLQAENPRRVLSLMAARFYSRQPKVIAAVTGTNGKTSVASFLRQIWTALHFDAASLGTIGIVTEKDAAPISHTTPDPVSLHTHLAALAADGITHLALEASSHGLAQYRLDGVALSAGAFTNITRDHLDYHRTFEDYLCAKLRLFRELLPPGQPAVVDPASPGSEAAIEAARQRKLNVFTVGAGGNSIRLLDVRQRGFSQELALSHAGAKYTVSLPLPGAFQVSNALIAAGLGIALGGEPDAVFRALGDLRGAKGRLEYVGETEAGAPIFVDYAHTPDALAKALEALRPYVRGRLHVVFGCGGDRDPGKRPQMGGVAAAKADAVYVTDDNPRSEDPASIRRAILECAPGAVEIASRFEAIAVAIEQLKSGDVLLIAGKGHETGQIVGNTVMPFSDHEAVASVLSSRNDAVRGAGHG